MLSDLSQYYENRAEPVKGCMLALRQAILNYDSGISEAWKYRMPMFMRKGRMFCHLWTDKKTGEPYVCFSDGRLIDHPALEQEGRARMKVLRVDASGDLPIKTLNELLALAVKVQEQKQ